MMKVKIVIALLFLLPAFSPAAEPEIKLESILSTGLNKPIGLTHAGDGGRRLFINEQAGRIRIFDQRFLGSGDSWGRTITSF